MLTSTADCLSTTLWRHLTSYWGSAAFFPNNGPTGFHKGDKRSLLWIVIEKHVKQPTIKRSTAKRLAFPVFMWSTEETKHMNCTWLLTSQNITSFKWEDEKCNSFLTLFSLWSADMKTEPISAYLPEVTMKPLNVKVRCFIKKEEWLLS